MFKILKKIVVLLALIVIGLIVFVALQPSHYTVTRKATFSAPAPVVFAQVNDFHKWEAWSPWAKMDPAAKNTFGGAPAGTGAMFSWVGNKDVGEGGMMIIESRPNEGVKIKLEFKKPFESTCISEFAFQPLGDQTVVTWTMSGENNFIGKAFCLFANMDKMVGGDFEKGLASMKTVAEAGKAGKETLVTLTFADRGEKTELTLRQTGFNSIQSRDGHGQGWTSTFERLGEYLKEGNERHIAVDPKIKWHDENLSSEGKFV